MKKRKLYIVAACVMGLGLIVGFIGFSMMNFTLEEFSKVEEYEENVYVANEKVAGISVIASNTPVEVISSPDGVFKIEYTNRKKEYYDITLSENGDLCIKNINTRKWYDYFMLNFNSRIESVKIYVPYELTKKIDIMTSNGGIDIRDITAAGLYAKTSNGQVFVTGINTENAKFISLNGKVSAENVKASSISLESSNGTISLKDVESLSIDAKTSNGKILFSDISSENMNFKTSNGKIRGDINGLMAEYSIISETSNGANNLPLNMPGGAKKLSAKTSNGEINISFKN